jgi:nucleoid DNA-binding protein
MCRPLLLYFWILNLLHLNPRKSNTLLKEVAEESELDVTLVTKVVEYYWNQVYKNIVNLENTGVQVANFGTFEVKPRVLDKKIESFTNYLQDEKNLVFSKYHTYKYIEIELEKMLKLRDQLDKRYEEKRNFKKNKSNNNQS